MLRRLHAPDRGASFLEYAAVYLVVGVVAAVLFVALPPRVGDAIAHGMDCIFQQVLQGDCEDEDVASGEQAAAGDESSSEPADDPDDDDPEDSGSPSDTRVVAPDDDAAQPENADLPEEEPGEEGQPENADLPADSAEEPVDAEPVSFWSSGDEEPPLAPDPETKPDEVNDWWEGLSAAERREVMREEPDRIRGLDGIPAEVRDELNREFLTDEVERMLEEEGLTRDEVVDYTLDEVRDNPVDGAPSLELWELTKLERTLTGEGPEGNSSDGEGGGYTQSEGLSGDDYYLLALDPEEKRSIVSVGNPDTADNVATMVPGTNIKWTAVNGQLGRAVNLHTSATLADSEAEHAVITWIGYDAPSWIEAPFGGAARDGKDDLQDFQFGLRATHEGGPSNNTLIGHSYGSVVVGEAARNNSGVYVDNVVLVGSPGVRGELSELNFDGGIEDIHIVTSEDDWIRDRNGFHSFDDLWGTEATYVRTKSTTEHDTYFNRPQTPEMRHVGEVIAGRRDD